MKKLLLTLLISGVVLVSCAQKEPKTMTFEPSTVTVSVGGTAKTIFAVTDGNNHEVNADADKAIATYTIEKLDNNRGEVTVTGVKTGTTKLVMGSKKEKNRATLTIIVE